MKTGGEQFTLGFAAVAAGAVAIGAAPIFMRFADVTPTASAFWRLALSLPFLFAWAAHETRQRGTPLLPLDRASVRSLLIVGLLFATELFFWHQSVARTTVANATLLANMATVFAALYSFLFFGDRFSRAFLLGLLMALTGAGALIGQNAELNPAYLPGDLLGMITAVTYGGYIVAAARARARFSAAQVMFASAVVTTAILGIAALAGGGRMVPTSADGWLPLIGLALVSHVIGQSLIIFGLAHVPAALGAGTLLVQPVVAALLAWVIFAEALGPLHLVGAAFIFGGILVAKRSLQPARR
jgi:drug/metabolite transporter (DMT)-like permease